ncbi:AraC family transcriptional regulator [Acinetobacter sp. NCu2D-2]|uniref:AraC family transcriptional regulator n=1 Tax=Acinetobacter sp. NCu2D-2 TaxID=1608473 RepID=UPI0007CDF55F|nr:AraC family transcriptional regulator [Acinetobacter sp. NCu2D-2]ANF81824.1 AraC family transcriptional regulator [Acinetobacter sp. NCu2D-2]
MDALSKIFDDIHLAKSEYIYINAPHPSAFQYEDEPSMLAYIVLNGTAHLTLQNEEQILLEQGDLFLIPSGKQHFVYCDEKSDLQQTISINTFFITQSKQVIDLNETQSENKTFILAIRSKLDVQMAKPLLSALPQFLHIKHISDATAPEWLQIGLQFLAVETQTSRPGRDKILDHLVSILFIECVRDYILSLDQHANWLGALTHPELSNALTAIHGQPEQNWTVESLAEQCHMSRSKFAQLFNQIVGDSPLAYLQQHRLRLAAQYLRDTGLSVQQIAHSVGYNSETAFSQIFKKQFGLTPSIYRKQAQII